MNNKIFLLTILFIVFTFANLHADAGVPMLMLAWPGMIVSLIPVILIESFYQYKKLRVNRKSILFSTSISNIVSTVIGIPLTWFILVFIQMITGGGGVVYDPETVIGKILSVTWQAAWLLPYESDLLWMIPTAMVVLLIPFFFVSWIFEYWTGIFLLRKKDITKSEYKKVIFKANIWSYSFLLLLIIIYSIYSIIIN